MNEATRRTLGLGVLVSGGAVLVELLNAWLPPLSWWARAGLDAGLLTLALASACYFLFFRPAHRKEVRQREAEAALRDSEALYSSLVENLTQNVFRKDLAGRFTFANQRFCQTLGRPLAEILGKTDADFFPQQLAEDYRRDDRRVVETGAVLDRDEVHQTPSGNQIHVHVLKTPVRDAQGQVIGVQGIFWDISERVRMVAALRRSEERFRLFMDNNPAIAWIKDDQGRYVYLSKTFEKQFGVRLRDWQGKTDKELWPPETAEEFQRNDQAVLAGTKLEGITETARNPDGTDSNWLVFKFLVQESSGKRFVGGIGLDITERERLMAELRESVAKIKTLSGLVPICASCKKIRDDRGFWQQVETFVAAHSEAKFSHGICPDCMRQLYPDAAEGDAGGEL